MIFPEISGDRLFEWQRASSAQISGKIGFLHFGEKYEEPLQVLDDELSRAGEEALAGALIVLPEGFNIGKCYHDKDMPENPVPDVIVELRTRARSHLRVAFAFTDRFCTGTHATWRINDNARMTKTTCHVSSINIGDRSEY